MCFVSDSDSTSEIQSQFFKVSRVILISIIKKSPKFSLSAIRLLMMLKRITSVITMNFFDELVRENQRSFVRSYDVRAQLRAINQIELFVCLFQNKVSLRN